MIGKYKHLMKNEYVDLLLLGVMQYLILPILKQEYHISIHKY